MDPLFIRDANLQFHSSVFVVIVQSFDSGYENDGDVSRWEVVEVAFQTAKGDMTTPACLLEIVVTVFDLCERFNEGRLGGCRWCRRRVGWRACAPSAPMTVGSLPPQTPWNSPHW